MKTEQNQVREFMVKARQATPDRPHMPSRDICKLRIRLIAEELLELCDALDVNLVLDRLRGSTHTLRIDDNDDPKTDLVEAYDGILDLMVVVIGTGVALGLDLQPGWDEVHRSNMSKFIDGHRREDGKWIKGPSYSAPNLAPLVQQQKQQLLLG